MSRRKVFAFAIVVLATVLIVLSVQRNLVRFRDFQIAHPDANGWEFLLTEKPDILIGLLLVIGYLLVKRWFEKNVPAVDADKTEFHEEGVR